MTNNQLISRSHVKRKIRASGKRSSKGFIEQLNVYVHYVVDRCTKNHNAGRATLDRELLALLFPMRF